MLSRREFLKSTLGTGVARRQGSRKRRPLNRRDADLSSTRKFTCGRGEHGVRLSILANLANF